MNMNYVVWGLLLSFIGPIVAADNAGAFIEKGISARATGMGMGFTALATDSHAVYWNTAGLSQLTKPEVQVLGAQAYDTSYFSVQSAFEFKGQKIGVQYVGAFFDGVEETQASEVNQGQYTKTGRTYEYRADAVYLGIGKSVTPKLSVGLAGKVVHEKAGGYNATGLGLDVGGHIQAADRLQLGANLQNIIKPKMEWNTPSKSVDTIPQILKVGLAYDVLIDQWQLSADAVLRHNRTLKLNWGSEYWIASLVAVRGGFQDNQLSLGTGLRIAGFSADLAWVNPHLDEANEVYRFSIGIQLEKKKRGKSK